eukprot:3608759-Pyramimonas_sp.AAC.1
MCGLLTLLQEGHLLEAESSAALLPLHHARGGSDAALQTKVTANEEGVPAAGGGQQHAVGALAVAGGLPTTTARVSGASGGGSDQM